MTGPEYDAELEAFLKRRSLMYRRLSDIDHAEPSVELDRLVLNRAREAIETPSQPLFRSPRWAMPVGLAATILIAFTVVLNIDHHKPVASGAAPTAAAVPPAPTPAVARAASVRESVSADQPRVLSDSVASEQHDAQAEKKAEAPAVALAKRSASAESQNAASRAPLVASTGAALGQAPLSQPGPAAPPASPAPPAAATASATVDPHSSPEAWLREINRLRAAGRTAEADRQLTAFREAYPSHPAYSVAKPPAR